MIKVTKIVHLSPAIGSRNPEIYRKIKIASIVLTKFLGNLLEDMGEPRCVGYDAPRSCCARVSIVT